MNNQSESSQEIERKIAEARDRMRYLEREKELLRTRRKNSDNPLVEKINELEEEKTKNERKIAALEDDIREFRRMNEKIDQKIKPMETQFETDERENLRELDDLRLRDIPKFLTELREARREEEKAEREERDAKRQRQDDRHKPT